jgi:hypothetical protein
VLIQLQMGTQAHLQMWCVTFCYAAVFQMTIQPTFRPRNLDKLMIILWQTPILCQHRLIFEKAEVY